MSFNLVARLSIHDTLSAKMKKATQTIESAGKTVNATSKSVGAMGRIFGKTGDDATRGLSRATRAAGMFRDATGRMRNAQGQFVKETANMQSALVRVGNAGRNALSSIGYSIVQLPGKFSQATSKIRGSLKSGIETPAISVKGAIAGIATSIVGSLGALNLFQAGMDRLSSLENAKLSLTVMMGDASEASKFMDEVLAFAKQTPFAFPDLATTARNLYSFGMDKAKIIPTMKAIGDAAAASGKGSEGLNQIAGAFGQMQVAGQLSLEEVNRLHDAGVPALKILANQFGVTTDVMKKKISDGSVDGVKAIDTLVEGMQKGTDGLGKKTAAMAGIMEKTKDTWIGSIDSMKSAISSTMAKILEPIKPKLQKAMALFGKAFSTLPDLVVFFSPLLKAMGIFIASVAGIYAVIGAFSALGLAIGFLVSPIGLISAGIAALGYGLYSAYKNSEPFRKTVDGLIGSIRGLFTLLSDNTMSGSSKAMNIMAKAGLDHDQIIKVARFASEIRQAFTQVSDAFKVLKSGDGEGFMKKLGFSPEVIASVMDFTEIIKTRVAEFITFLSEKWQQIQPSIQTLIDSFTIAKDTVTSVFITLWSVLEPIFSAIMSALHIVADVVTMVFVNVVAPLIKLAWTLFQTLWNIVGPILKLLGSAIGVAFGVLKIVWDTIAKPFLTFLMGVFKDGVEAIAPIIKGIGKAFEFVGEMINKVSGWFDSFTRALSKFKVPAWLSKLGGGGTVKFESNAPLAEPTSVMQQSPFSQYTTPATTTVQTGKSVMQSATLDKFTSHSNYHGIDSVPYDGYQTTLHKDEAVLTAKENKERKKGSGGINIAKLADTIVVREEADIDKFADKFVKKLQEAWELGAG